MILKLSELRVVAFVQFERQTEKNIVTLRILGTKNLFLTAHNPMGITLS